MSVEAATTSKYADLPVTVEKNIPVTYDLGLLSVFDSNPVNGDNFNSSNSQREQYIKDLTRDNTQLLINQLLQQPIQTTTDSSKSTISLIKLPESTTELPREKPLPKPKAPTKWELFAAKKGIQKKRKEGKLEYDEHKGEWVNKWGYNKKSDVLAEDWLVEINENDTKNSDGLLDPRALKRADRKKLIKKNELQHKRNLQNNK
ncbi:hypothetical protein QEN19_000487 [Hanseniaspora menglaensis]